MELEKRKLYKEQINRYKELRPLYKEFHKYMKKILKNIVRGYSSEFIIQGRVKKISSFANKLFKSETTITIPFLEINDLCGLRVILPNINELNAVSEAIRDNFLFDTVNGHEISELTDISTSLGHFQTYVVQLMPELKLYERLGLNIPDNIFNLKAEIQICTYLSYGWAANQHKIFSKYEFNVPKPYDQELSRVKSLLTIEDESLNKIMKKMRDYENAIISYMSTEKIKSEIERLEMVYDADKENFKIGYRIAKLAMSINNMDKSIGILNELMKSESFKEASELEVAEIIRDLGISYHQKYKKNPKSNEFLKGQNYLREAAQRNPFDSNGWSSLGGTYKSQKNYPKALECYKQALKVNPGDPYPLGNYLILIIQQTGDLIHIERNYDMIQKAIKKRLKQIEVMVDAPWAFFDVGLFNLFLGNVNEALDYYLKGIRYSSDIWMIETTLNTLNNLKIIEDKLTSIHLVRQVLRLGVLFHPNVVEKTTKLINESTFVLDSERNQMEHNLDESIVIIAGGTDKRFERNLEIFNNNLIESFKNYKGTIISGGTLSGICATVGKIQEKYSDNIKTIGYVPSHMPAYVELDRRYSSIHFTEGSNFSIREPIQYWYDIMKSGIEPSKIKLIGINGGDLAAFEFHLAIVFGAQVGIMRNSGRAATELINDPSWEEPTGPEYGYKPKKLFKVLKNTPEDIYNFLTKPFIVDPDIENIQKLLIQHRESGANQYELNFTTEDVDNTIFSGFLTALDHIASQALKVGEILSIKFSYGHLSGGFFTNKEFKVVFLLNETPSPTLEEKIVNFIKQVEAKLGDHLHKLHLSCQSYVGGEKMNEILSNVFGSEILKLLDKKTRTKPLEMPQEM